jgi:hypothetical protein
MYNPYTMLSSFLKKLLFARQFFMIDGKIEVLGKQQVMLPTDVLIELEKDITPQTREKIRLATKQDFAEYAKKVGSSEEGMLRNIHNIFETFGLGKLQVVDVSHEHKRCAVHVHKAPASQLALLEPILSGMFSFLFDKDLNAEHVENNNQPYEEYKIQ